VRRDLAPALTASDTTPASLDSPDGRGASNVYADYWVFAPATEQFEYLGNYPALSVDVAHRELSTYENAGMAGLIYEKSGYRFIDGKPELVWREDRPTAKSLACSQGRSLVSNTASWES
jgi:hypothetical protein